MTDAEYEAMKAQITAAHLRWRGLLGLANWRGTLVWMRDSNPASGACMDVTFRWGYLYYVLNVHMLAVSLGDPEPDIDELIAHELVHVVLAPLVGCFPENARYELEHEHVTTHLSRVLSALAREDEPAAAAVPAGFCDRCPHGRHDGICGQQLEPGGFGCGCNRNGERLTV